MMQLLASVMKLVKLVIQSVSKSVLTYGGSSRGLGTVVSLYLCECNVYDGSVGRCLLAVDTAATRDLSRASENRF